jgi:hypothetical protein
VLGSRLLVWADRSGPVAGTLPTGGVITARAIAAGLLALAFLVILLLGVTQSARWLLERRRLAA